MSKEVQKDREVIASMFNGIADKYDLLNLLLSFGIDTLWRKKLIKFVTSSNPGNLLDIACGTGDLALIFAKKRVKVTGADISSKMLEVAGKKADKLPDSFRPEFILASADELPFEENSFDSVTISFGIRNFEKRDLAITEIQRVLKQGGSLAILEFASPRNKIWNGIYGIYLKYFVPFVGRLISGDKYAYSYLSDSISTFPKYEAFCDELNKAGFDKVKYRSLSGGIAALYTAFKN